MSAADTPSPVTERMRRQIDRLLDEAEDAITRDDWPSVRQRAEAALRLDPGNADALGYLAAASRDGSDAQSPAPTVPLGPTARPATPATFVGGRYQVRDLLGDG